MSVAPAIWIVAAAVAGVIVRPFRWPEAIWAVAGALALVAIGALSPGAAWAAVARGGEVYLFLAGMMLLSETARAEGLFDWLAAWAAAGAEASSARLFGLVFALATVVTIFLSNDATAVVLTPAVYAVARRARADPWPLLFACALVANAASFVLPISNPANLVLYGGHMPPLGRWLASFALPSLLALAATWAALRWLFREPLARPCADPPARPPLAPCGRIALAGIIGTGALLLAVSLADRPLGAPTCAAGAITALVPAIRARRAPWRVLRGIAWSVLPLVAGLFVLVEGLVRAGLVGWLAAALQMAVARSAAFAAAAGALALGFGSNFTNNLPAGLVASRTIAVAAPPRIVIDALLIAVDLGPNLAITGSLATILWLGAIRREGATIGFWRFLKVGAVAMPPALLLAVGARLALG